MTRARPAGITGTVITGTDLQEILEACKLAQRHVGYCWSTAGLHPHYASGWDDEVAGQIYALTARQEVAAIDECWLDFNRDFSAFEQREAAFSAQLTLAAELAMPIFFHCREVHARFAALLAPWLGKLPAAMVHCFTDTAKKLESC